LAKPELGTDLDDSLFRQPEEKVLFDLASKVDAQVEDAILHKDYAKAIERLASTRPDVDKFFDEVLVMAEETQLKENRLKLLNKCVEPFLKIADFSELVVPGD
jgi:glycyl-tRNA synthetase beta chain